MKKVIFISIIIFSFLNSNAQRLALTDLINLCNKKNWEDVNYFLLSKNWLYYDSEKGSSLKYNTITWSFNKEYHSDKAQAWFYLYTYENYPNKVAYTVLNKESYSLIEKSLSINGFKLINSEIEDNQIISSYSNQNYILEISTAKKEESEWSNRSITTYNITLIKKAGIYDPDNGLKTEYYDNGYSVLAEYVLKNGKLHGSFKSYYLNGNLKKIGVYSNDKENGLFKEFYENGTINIEYSMKDGVLNGVLKTFYENGQIKKTGNFINGKENGLFKEYAENGNLKIAYNKLNDEYNGFFTEITYDDNDSILLEYSGFLKNDMKDSIWNLYLYRNDKKELAEFTTYKNGIKNGKFKKIQGDSLIYGYYANDKLNGSYVVYTDLLRAFLGLTIRTDSADLNILSRGEYYDDKKSGNWIFYSFSGYKSKEGYYQNDLKDGEWKYFYSSLTDDYINYLGELYLIKNYKSGELNGKSLRYSYINEEKILCDTTLNKNISHLDSCTKTTFVKCFESSHYKNNLLHGPYIFKDSVGNIRLQGSYVNNKKEGMWIESYLTDNANDTNVIYYQEGNYINDKKEGKWIEYFSKNKIFKEYYYSKGKLNGKYYNYYELTREIKTFENDNLKTLSIYDSTGLTILRKFEILEETDNYLKFKKIDFGPDIISSLEYYMKKDEPKLKHNLFEITFVLKSSEYFDGDDCYPNGILTVADNENNIILTGNLFKTNRIGIWSFNYPLQNVQIQINYLNGKPEIEKYLLLNSNKFFSGIFKYNDYNNGLMEERKIKNGLRNGKTIYIDIATRRTIKTEKYINGEIK